MMKRTVHALVLMLLAAPLALVGCGDSGEKNGTGGSGGGAGGTAGATTYDGGGGTGGVKYDATPADVVTLIDTTVAPDVPITTDTTAVDVALPIDVSITLDTGAVDAPAPVDTGAVDTTPVIDTTPAVCTMTTPFTGGNVTADLTLPAACSPYTIKTDIRVDGNATLTIEAGAILRFQPDTRIWIGYSSAAKIVAVGTAASPITFTSANVTPGAGDWAGITFWSGTMNGNNLAYAKFDYCGSNGDACILGSGAKANRVAIDHVTIAHVGAGSNGITEKDTDSNFAISNCTFNNIPAAPTQQYAISVEAPSFAGIGTTNTYNGAMIELAGGTVSTTTDWKNLGTTVAVTDDLRLEGPSTPALTIEAGSIFKFAAGLQFWIGYSDSGSLIVKGTAIAPVTFTSLNASPLAGDWVGIVVWTGSASITYATISYAGSDKGDVSVARDTGSLNITSSTLSNSATYGIGIPCNSAAAVTSTGNTFTSNTSGNTGPGPAGVGC
jgi:hypothetical protein